MSRHAYTYDPAGNRTIEQIGDNATLSTHDVLNRLSQQQPGGTLRFAGTISEPATVTIQGKPAVVDATNTFSGAAPTVAGTNTVTIQALDPSGNATNVQYQVTLSGTGRIFSYDANGNLTSDGVRTFEWDARNQLVAVIRGSSRSEFTYDGLQRRVRELEIEAAVTVSDTRIIWCQTEICEERAADGTTVVRRPLAYGEQLATGSHLFARDHLGTVWEVSDAANTLLARYSFDPWGRRTLKSGSDVTREGFTGHRWHESSEGWLARFRLLDASTGRWASQDPAGSVDGPNLFAYVLNKPTKFADPDGLKTQVCCRLLSGAKGIITRQRHCFVVVAKNPDVGNGRVTTYSLVRRGSRGETEKNNQEDLRSYSDWSAECYDASDCTPCNERKMDKEQSDPGPSANYSALGPNSNTYANNLVERGGCTPPPVTRAPGYYY